MHPDKCSWCLIEFCWDKDGNWHYSSKLTLSAALTIPNPEGEIMEIKRLGPDETIKVVGVVQVADSNMKGQMEMIQDKIDNMGKKLHDGWVPRQLAWQGFTTMIWPSLSYTLPAMTFMQKQADKLMTQLYKLILLTLGALRGFLKVYCHASKSLQGLGAPNFYVEQTIGKIGKLLTNGNTPSMMGKLIVAQLEQAQLEVGIGTPILLPPFDPLGCLLTDCWTKGIWEFASKYDIALSMDEYVLPALQQVGDKFIMAKLIHIGNFMQAELIHFNWCRI